MHALVTRNAEAEDFNSLVKDGIIKIENLGFCSCNLYRLNTNHSKKINTVTIKKFPPAPIMRQSLIIIS